MEIRLASSSDYNDVRDFYYALIDAMEDAEFKPGWEKDIYPTQEFLIESIANNELYIGEIDGEIATCMVVNHSYVDSSGIYVYNKFTVNSPELVGVH